MIVACPKCSTKYNLPDGQFRPGAKARCTVCSEVFPLVTPEDSPKTPQQEQTFAPFGADGAHDFSETPPSSSEDIFSKGLEDDGFASSVPERSDSSNNFSDMFKEGAAPSGKNPEGSVDFGSASSGLEGLRDNTLKADVADSSQRAKSAPLDEPLPYLPPKREIPWKIIASVGVLLLFITGGVWFFWNRKIRIEALEASRAAARLEKIKGFNVQIDRQFTVQNDKVGQKTGRAMISGPVSETPGKIYVIEGTVTNNFTTPKASIKLAVSLIDDQGRVLGIKEQLAGTSATPFQLSVMNESDLEQYLNDPLTIMSNNSMVLPGSKIPFTVVFYRLFNKAASIQVKVVDAVDPNFGAAQ